MADQFEHDEADEPQALPGLGVRMLAYALAWFPGLQRLVLVLAYGVLLLPIAGLCAYGVWAMREGEPWGLLFAVIASVIHAQALAWLMTGSLVLLSEAIYELEGRRSVLLVLASLPVPITMLIASLQGQLPTP